MENSPVLLISVGGSEEAIRYSVRHHKPRMIWYFCSSESRAVAERIHAELEWHPDRDFILTTNCEDLRTCYRVLRKALPPMLEKWCVPVENVIVDYTAGTKTMSAALVLAAVEWFSNFSYVGAEQREKEGLGVAKSGYERIVFSSNPWLELAVREVERARDLWAACLFDQAGEVLRKTADKVPARKRFEAIADLAGALGARHHLQFKDAITKLGKLTHELPLLYDGCDYRGLLDFVRETLRLCTACKEGKDPTVLLGELLDNALRTAEQGRYEDAAARLYRAMELQGQIWLEESTHGAFKNGRYDKESGKEIPPQLLAQPFCPSDARSEIRLSMEAVYRALAILGHEIAQRIVEDIESDTDSRGRSRWRRATEKRNSSILGHGTEPVAREGFENMKELAQEFLGWDLSYFRHPIPPLDPAWLNPVERP